MGGFLSFDKMITPTLIKIVCWIGLIQAAGLGLVVLISGFTAAAAATSEHSPLGGLYGIFGLVGGVLVFVISVFLTRIFCELMILSFRIYETLVQIRDRNAGPAQASAGYYQPQAVMP